METTFISIHNLEPDARILYSSDSVVDILGYTPDELVNRSAWEFFPKEELPYAQKFHQKRVSMDKAAVLAYCRVRDKDGEWVGCECCFTTVYDVMIVCTSIYSRGLKSQKRALEAPIVRRIFSSSPSDPRYHMLSHISQKFAQPSKAQQHEPRAALFLNRFTKTLSIMYATSGLQDVIGVPAESLRGRSFYYCIAQNCLADAIDCLETAKGNDSIAYLRFWFRDPRQDDHPPPPDNDSDEEMTTDTNTSIDNDDGGVGLRSLNGTSQSSATSMEIDKTMEDLKHDSSGDSTHEADTHEAIFGHHRPRDSSASSLAPSPDAIHSPRQEPPDPIELEAVISCTSDGLVVCLRRARPMIPHPLQRPSKPVYQNGLFAAPWAAEPILPGVGSRARAGFNSGFAPALGPQGVRPSKAARVRAPDHNGEFMNAIRDQAIFAWGVTGINGGLAEFGRGKPLGESLPRDGLPIWASDPRQPFENGHDIVSVRNEQNGTLNGISNGMHNGMQNGVQNRRPGVMHDAMANVRSGPHIFGDPGLGRNGSSSGTRSASSGYGTSNGGTPHSM